MLVAKLRYDNLVLHLWLSLPPAPSMQWAKESSMLASQLHHVHIGLSKLPFQDLTFYSKKQNRNNHFMMIVSTGDPEDHGVENNTRCLLMLHVPVFLFLFSAMLFTIFFSPPGSDLRNLKKQNSCI